MWIGIPYDLFIVNEFLESGFIHFFHNKQVYIFGNYSILIYFGIKTITKIILQHSETVKDKNLLLQKQNLGIKSNWVK